MELQYYLETYSPSVLNLGCGKSCPAEHYGVDIEDFAGVSLVYDLARGIPLPDNTFDTVMAKDVLEHIPQGRPCVRIMEEIYRVLKPGGVLEMDVPSTDGGGIGAFGHPYHVSWWSKNTVKYFLDDSYTNGWRSSINVKCWFVPITLVTYFNEHDMPYVRGELRKKELA